MTSIAHLTHTKVLRDARILRELNALGIEDDLDVHAYGVRAGDVPSAQKAFDVTELVVRSERAAWLPRPMRYALVMVELNARLLKRLLLSPPDIVHCHDAMVLPAGAVSRVVLGSSLIYDAHELESDKNGQNAILSRATLALERAAWPFVDALISVSPSIVSWYMQHLGGKESLCLLNSPEICNSAPSAVDVTTQDLRSVIGVGDEEALYVYVGVLGKGRGLRAIAEAFSRDSVSAHVAFVGAGELPAEVETLSVENPKIHRCSPVPHDRLVEFIQGADGGFCLIEDVSLSDHYCLPNKLFEYAFAGLPVIASRLPDIAECVQRYNLGTCIDIDADQIEDVVKHGIPRDRGSRERLRALSWQNQADNLRHFYRDLIRRRPIRSRSLKNGWVKAGVR